MFIYAAVDGPFILCERHNRVFGRKLLGRAEVYTISRWDVDSVFDAADPKLCDGMLE